MCKQNKPDKLDIALQVDFEKSMYDSLDSSILLLKQLYEERIDFSPISSIVILLHHYLLTFALLLRNEDPQKHTPHASKVIPKLQGTFYRRFWDPLLSTEPILEDSDIKSFTNRFFNELNSIRDSIYHHAHSTNRATKENDIQSLLLLYSDLYVFSHENGIDWNEKISSGNMLFLRENLFLHEIDLGMAALDNKIKQFVSRQLEMNIEEAKSKNLISLCNATGVPSVIKYFDENKYKCILHNEKNSSYELLCTNLTGSTTDYLKNLKDQT